MVKLKEKSCTKHFGMKNLCVKCPKSAKKTVKLTFFFALLGSARIKTACRTLVKSTPGGVMSQLELVKKILRLYQNC